jgi:geranylgeranyl diphosphate synthase, type II
MVLDEQYLEHVRKDVDLSLDQLLPKSTVEPARLHEAMRYSIFAGGRRFRPALCIASCEAVGGLRDAALLPASAIEALHTYTLIHDDLPAMDDDDMRRGKPSSHKAFDEGTAVLAGDALLTIAFEWLGNTGNARLVEELARATGSQGTVGGQQADLDSKHIKISRDEVLSIHARKTAALFRVACRMGAIAADASEEDIESLGLFGEHLGIAFQLLDDVCDNDPVTMNVFEREEVISLASQYEKSSYDALTKIPNSEQLKALAEYTYASFVV